MRLLDQAKSQIAKLIEKEAGTYIAPELFTVPPKPEMGDLALPCFTLAKAQGKNPAAVAADLAARITPAGLVARVQAFGPYVNFFLVQEEFGAGVIDAVLKSKKSYGSVPTKGKKPKVLVEFSQPNTHKEYHVGHLRNAVLGVAVCNLLDALGNDTIRATYVNDYGSFVAKTLWGWGKKEVIKRSSDQEIKLGDVYAYGARMEKESPEAAAQIKEILHKFQVQHDKKLTALWKKTRTISLKEFAAIYKELGVRFSKRYFESDLIGRGRAIVDKLQQQGILMQSQGAIIADLSAYGLDVVVVVRSDGTSQYAVGDLALAERKFADFKLDAAYWIVDVRQELYFKQLTKILELSGNTVPLHHLSYEFVQLPSGALSSRSGNVLTYWDVRDQLVAKSIEETKKRHPDWSAKKVERTALAIAIAGLKFGMLRQQMHKIVTFDIDEALQFQGFTGPYVQYTAARLHSVLRKAGRSSATNAYGYPEAEEKAIIGKLAAYPDLIASLRESLEPSRVAQYVYELAQDLNTFYHHHQILQAEPVARAGRLRLIRASLQVLENALGILGIPVLKEM